MNMLNSLIFRLLLLISTICAASPLLCSETAKESGSLIVTYHTDADGTLLDRVRFWLVNDKHERRLYPQGNSYVDDDAKKNRTVLIEHLPKGVYTLQFMIPNRDQRFEMVPAKKVKMSSGGVVRIDQPIALRQEKESNPIAASNLDIYYERPESEIVIPKTGRRFYSYPSREPQYYKSLITVKSTLPKARWSLYHRGNLIITGEGEVSDIRVPVGEGYYVESEPFPDYTLRIYPSRPFDVKIGENVVVDVIYKRLYGYIDIEANLPTGEKVGIIVEGDPRYGGQASQATVAASNNKFVWRSKPLPAGEYTITLSPPPFYEPIPPIYVEVKQGQAAVVRPDFIGSRQIKVTSNTSEAVYLLRTQDGSRAWKGHGNSFTFDGLTPGSYIMTYASIDPLKAIPPQPKKIDISRYRDENPVINADYKISGQLRLGSNIEKFRVTIENLDRSASNTFRERVTDHYKTVSLPEGRYRVTFMPAKDGKGQDVPKPEYVEVKPYQLTEAYGTYSNVAEPLLDDNSFTDEDNGDTLEPIIPLDPLQTLVAVEAGETIVGDPFQDHLSNEMSPAKVYLDAFEINKYQVTNGQYAAWLSRILAEGNVIYHENGKREGVVTDHDGNTLFYTVAAEEKSQIFATKDSKGKMIFRPAPGKVDFPVIFVTWYGANLYCQDSKGRLPTEAEWETAAGRAKRVDGEPLKKYRYGFRRDDISRQWANYKDTDTPTETMKVLTTKVGFYNGENLLPLKASDRKQMQTENAESPIGAYDMSGNVWEWVFDWYSADYDKAMPDRNPQGPQSGTKKVAKGGCYDSLAPGVRVAERLAIPPDYADEFTGFRIAR